MSTVIEIPRELKEVGEDMRGEGAEDMWKDLREAKYVIRSNGVGEEEKETVMRSIQKQREESKEGEEDEELGGGPEQDEMREEPRIEDLEEREENKNESGSALDQQNKDRERQIRGKRKREEGTSRNNQKRSAREETVGLSAGNGWPNDRLGEAFVKLNRSCQPAATDSLCFTLARSVRVVALSGGCLGQRQVFGCQ